MKYVVSFLLMLNSCLYGQGNKFTVSGVVTDCKTKEGIKDVVVRIIGKDGTDFQKNTDSLGNYSFDNCFDSNTSYILTTQVNNTVGISEEIKYGICPYGEREKNGYLTSSDKYKFMFADTITKLKYDICLIQTYSCSYRIFPDFQFQKNSTDFESVNWVKKTSLDTLADCFTALLMAQKTWVIEIQAHASKDEKNPQILSDERAKKIVELFTSRGIDKERLVWKGCSNKRPIEFKDETGGIIKKGKEETQEHSRRVTISLLRRDYDPLTKKPKVDPEEEKRLNELKKEDEK